jgi:hypothetical protein
MSFNNKIIVFFLGMVFVSCSKQNATLYPSATPQVHPIFDGGLISRKPCAPPCFFGVFPGQSKDEAIISLKKSGLCENYIETNKTNIGGVINIGCGNNITIELNNNGDIVDGIIFLPDSPILLSEVIANFGPPDKVCVAEGGVHVKDMAFDLIYNKNIIFLQTQSKSFDERGYYIQTDTLINSIGYWREININLDINNMSNWKGYGYYKH